MVYKYTIVELPNADLNRDMGLIGWLDGQTDAESTDKRCRGRGHGATEASFTRYSFLHCLLNLQNQQEIVKTTLKKNYGKL